MDHLKSLIDENTAAILVNNPSNPCGSVYSKSHLKDIIDIAEENFLPIIADEIYGNMVFKGHEFIPMASLTQNVPIISCSGLAKQYLVPGWRVGWILIYDRENRLKEVAAGMKKLAMIILSTCTVMQAAIPDIIKNTPADFMTKTMAQLEENANLVKDYLLNSPGLEPIVPQGTLYLMAKINSSSYRDIKCDIDFMEKLLQEEAVMCLPGTVSSIFIS